mmetsp:Transcript_10667/g.18746  ORF Transcript_10667/g.18746 Transcript_10667/m.18746 type:complete len:369 (-) Transcript_10667:27-1133(-)
MVAELLLPKDGGGSLRRFVSIRQRLYRDQWNDSRPLRGPVPLFDFRRKDDVADLRASLVPGRLRGLFAGWRVSDDGVIGGFSTSQMDFHEGVKNDHLNGNSTSSSSSPPFLRWSGTLSTKINHQSHLARNVTRSGFAAVLSPEYPLGVPLGNKYKALEICCRTDGRTYAVNLHVESYFPEDVYQGFIVGGKQQPQQQHQTMNSSEEDATTENKTIASLDEHEKQSTIEQAPSEEQQTLDVRQHIKNRTKLALDQDPTTHPYHGHPPHGFQRYVLPFREFALTSRGRMRHAQRDLDGNISIESIGFTLMDGKDGDFCFDLVSLRAVNVLEGEVVGTLEDDQRLEELSERLHRGSVEEGTEEADRASTKS